MHTKIMGVKIDNVTEGEAIDLVVKFLSEGREHLIFTPNPEMIMAAQDDSVLKDILNQSDLNVCDGKGIKYTCALLQNKYEREKTKYFKCVPGADFMIDICDYASKYEFSVYLLGSGNEAVIARAAKNLKRRFLQLINLLKLSEAQFPSFYFRILLTFSSILQAFISYTEFL